MNLRVTPAQNPRRITEIDGVYYFAGRPFEFEVDGPMHPDDAPDAEVYAVRWLDDGPEAVPDEVFEAIYDELADEVFERATIP